MPSRSENAPLGLFYDEVGFSGLDPREMTSAELSRAGHPKITAMKAIRRKCLDCCCQQTAEVRKCTAVDCPLWPLRMGTIPWRRKGKGGDRKDEAPPDL
jgi:hypothetical protein